MALPERLPLADLPLKGGQPGATVRVHPLRVGEVKMPPRYVDPPGGPLGRAIGLGVTSLPSRWYWAPIPAFLVEHPAAGPFLVDTGLHSSVAQDPRPNLGRAAAAFYQLRMEGSDALVAQLRERHGVEAHDVGLVVMTHLHFDHASAVTEFPNATFLVVAREWQAARSGGLLQGYRPAMLGDGMSWRALDYDDHGTGAWEGFAHCLDLFGDGSVRLLSTPGHSPGHQSLALRLRRGTCLLAADAAYTLRTVEHTLVPAVYADRQSFLESLAQIQAWVRDHPDAVVIPGHDPQTWAKLSPVYE